jgi:hypothetical protein
MYHFLAQEIFLQTGRVNHLDRVLAWHPTYQVRSPTCHHLLLLYHNG